MQLQVSAIDLLFVFAGIVVPWIFWEIRQNAIIVEILEMHKDPDRFGFGSQATNKILSRHTEALRQISIEQRQATDRLADAVHELTHYTKWLSTQQTNKVPPPPLVRGKR